MEILGRNATGQVPESLLGRRGLKGNAAVLNRDFQFVALTEVSLLQDALGQPHRVAVSPFHELDLGRLHALSIYICRAGLSCDILLEEKTSTMPSLADKTCVPCRGGVPPLKGKDLAAIHQQLLEPAEWKIVNEHHIVRSYRFPDFKTALAFVNRVGELAEEQGHHPDILLAWGKVEVTTWTHAVNGLTESDFILAAKIDGLPR